MKILFAFVCSLTLGAGGSGTHSVKLEKIPSKLPTSRKTSPIPKTCPDFSGIWYGKCTSHSVKPKTIDLGGGPVDASETSHDEGLRIRQEGCKTIFIARAFNTEGEDMGLQKLKKAKEQELPFGQFAKKFDFDAQRNTADFKDNGSSIRVDWDDESSPRGFWIQHRQKSIAKEMPEEDPTAKGMLQEMLIQAHYELTADGNLKILNDETILTEHNGKTYKDEEVGECILKPKK